MASTSQDDGQMMFGPFLEDLSKWLLHPRAKEEERSSHCQYPSMYTPDKDPEKWLAKYTGSHIDSVLPYCHANQDVHSEQDIRRDWSCVLKFVDTIAESPTENWLLHESTLGFQEQTMKDVSPERIDDTQEMEEDESRLEQAAEDVTSVESLSGVKGQQVEATASLKVPRKRTIAEQHARSSSSKDPAGGKRNKLKHRP